MAKQDVPVYIIAGFLESGKTRLIKELLEDPGFSEGEKTLIVVCEEGEEEYPEELLKRSNAVTFTVENQADLTYENLAVQNKHEKPARVIIEYNGTWSMNDILSMQMPASWVIAQIITPINAETFDLYINNMRQMMNDHIVCADLIIFNRCDREKTPVAKYWRNMKMTNRAAMLIFEDENGEMIEVDSKEILPYDLNAPVIEVKDDDFGVFYVDAMENPDRYEGKQVSFTGMVYREPGFSKGTFVPGRMAMTCCVNDMQFMGYLCHSKVADKLMPRTWVNVTARVHKEKVREYGGEGPVLYATKIASGKKPENEVVYLY